MADGKSENSWRQYYSLSWLGGAGAGKGVSHKHWQPCKNGDRRSRISHTGSSTVTLLNKYEVYHTVTAELNNSGLDSIKLASTHKCKVNGEKGKCASEKLASSNT